jgi:pimeloyl-ACP methyl ester carboxylesterase
VDSGGAIIDKKGGHTVDGLETTQLLTSDGTRIAVHIVGAGRPLILIHGYFSDAATNWIKYGHAELLAEAGFRVIMPDLRAHGESDKPHDPASYPPDILANDQLALIDHLGLTDFDLGGYSLGGRTVGRLLARGVRPGKAVISGMGLTGLTQTQGRGAFFAHVLENLGQHERHSREWMAEAFLKSSGGDPIALRQILETFVDTSKDELAALTLPVGVVCGVDDQDNGSAADLAAALPGGTLIEIPGNHMSAVTKPELGAAIRDFLIAN